MLISPGPLSSLNFHQADALFLERAEYLVVKTPSRPHFFWGNFLVFKQPPKTEDFQTWMVQYEQEFNVEEQGFISLTWDSPDKGEIKPFLDFGFDFLEQHVLELKHLKPGPGHDASLVIRPIESEQDWKQVVNTQWMTDWPLKSPQMDFITNKIATYRRLQDRGLGKRFGAFKDQVLLGDLGIYCRGEIGRFNNVMTLASQRNQGVCQSLVYGASKFALEHLNVKRLVIEASTENFATKVYQKVGYEIVSRSYEMTWMSDRWK